MLAALGGAPLIASMRPAVITGASRSVLCSGPLHCANATEFGGAAKYGNTLPRIHGEYASCETPSPASATMVVCTNTAYAESRDADLHQKPVMKQ